jgi:hypothetical protein
LFQAPFRLSLVVSRGVLLQKVGVRLAGRSEADGESVRDVFRPRGRVHIVVGVHGLSELKAIFVVLDETSDHEDRVLGPEFGTARFASGNHTYERRTRTEGKRRGKKKRGGNTQRKEEEEGKIRGKKEEGENTKKGRRRGKKKRKKTEKGETNGKEWKRREKEKEWKRRGKSEKEREKKRIEWKRREKKKKRREEKTKRKKGGNEQIRTKKRKG